MHSSQMTMGLINCQLSPLEKQYGHEFPTRQVVPNWGSTTKIMQRLGLLPNSTRVGFGSRIMNLERQSEKYFSFKITFPAISFLPTFKTSELKTLSQISPHMSNQKTNDVPWTWLRSTRVSRKAQLKHEPNEALRV